MTKISNLSSQVHISKLLLIPFAILTISCDDLGYQGNTNSSFAEVEGVSLNDFEQLVISWPAIQLSGETRIEYEIFAAKASELGLPAQTIDPHLATIETKLTSSNALYASTSTQAPAVIAALVQLSPFTTSSSGQTSSTLDLSPVVGETYFLAVRPKVGGQYREEDKLSKVIIFAKKKIPFNGVTHLSSETSTQSLALHWQAPVGISTEEILYKVYNKTATEINLESELASGGASVIDQTAASADTLGIQVTRYSASDSLIDQLTTGQANFIYSQEQYSLSKTLMIDQDEIYFVSSQNANVPTNVFIKLSFLASELEGFSGISSAEAINQDSVQVNWQKASNPEISEYRIYSGDAFKTLETTVTADQNSVSISGFTYGSTVNFGVRAVDSYGRSDSNLKTISVELNNSTPSSSANVIATSPTLGVTPASHNYGNVTVGTAAQTKDFTVINTGTKTLLGSFSLTNTTAFSKASDSCSGVVLEQDQACTLNILFSPTRIGSEASSISVEYTDFSSQNSSNFSFAVTGAGAANIGNFTGISGYSGLNATSVDLSWTNDSDATSYIIYKESGDSLDFLKTVAAPATGASLSGLTPLTEYNIKVYAQDENGLIATNDAKVTFTTPTLVTLTALTSYTFPSNPASVDDILSFDADNSSSSNTVFTCVYDQLIDGNVAGSTSCSTLPGFVNVAGLESDGQLNWKIGSSAKGQSYEMKFTGTVNGGHDSQIVVVSVKRDYERTSMIFGNDFHFGNSNQPRDNSSLWGNPQNIVSSGSTGSEMTLSSNFGQTTSSGYAGSGTTADPYHLIFDGSNDSGTISGFDDETDLLIMGWIKSTDLTSAQTIFSNGTGSSGAGIQLEQAYTNSKSQLILTVGGEDVYSEYDSAVLTDTPFGYWRFNQVSNTADVSNLGNSSNTIPAQPVGSLVVGATGLAQDSDDDSAVQISDSSMYYYLDNNSDLDETLGTRSMEVWFKADDVERIAPIMGYGQDNTSDRYSIRIVMEYGMVFCKATTNRDTNSYAGTEILPNVPYHVVLTFDTSGSLKCFVNGTLVDTDTAIASITQSTNNSTRMGWGIFLGNYVDLAGRGDSASYDFAGIIDDSATYDGVLSDGRAAAHYLPHDGAKCGAVNPVGQGEWSHVAVSYINNVGSLYINGVKLCSFTSASNGLTGGASNLTIGSDSTGSNFWAGQLGLLNIYNASANIDTDVSTHYSATKSEYTDNNMHALLPDLKYWIDASDLDADGLTNDQPADGSTITEWKDKSGYGTNLSSIIGSPKYSASVTSSTVPAVTFVSGYNDADNDALQIQQTMGPGYGNGQTAVIVFRMTDWNDSWTGTFGWTSTGESRRENLFLINRNNGANDLIINHHWQTSKQPYTPSSGNEASIQFVRRSGDNYSHLLDDNSSASEVQSSGYNRRYSSQIWLGGRRWSGTSFDSNRYADMDLFEVQLYNRYLSDEEVAIIKTNLEAKWK